MSQPHTPPVEATGRARRAVRAVGWPRLLVIVGYLLLVVTGTTTSSLGVPQMLQDPAHPAEGTFGTPRSIRSDEFYTQTPLELSYMAGGPSISTPLSAEPDMIQQRPSDGIVESVVFFDGLMLRLGPIAPDAMVFAAHWWLPMLLLLLSMPTWLIRLGAHRSVAWLATGLIAVAPSAAWWSFAPIRVLGYAVTGAALLLWAVDRLRAGKRISGVLLCLIPGVLWARLGTSYLPWALVLGVPVVLATAAFLVFGRDRAERRVGLWACAAAAASTVLMFAGLVLENLPAVRALAGTVYPGARRSSGSAENFGFVFGAPDLAVMQDAPKLVDTNLSEVSTGYSVAAVLALLLWLITPRPRRSPQSAALVVLAAFVTLWLAWCLIDWGGFGAMLPGLNLVPAKRAAQVVGMVAVLPLALLLSRLPDRSSWPVPLTAGLVTGGLTLIAGLALRSVVPSMPVWHALVCAAVLGVVAGLLVALPRNAWVLGATMVLALTVVWRVNPVQVGLGDLRASAAAGTLIPAGAQARADGTRWVSDSWDTDALLQATGVPILGGRQVSGPVVEQWKLLDPTEQYSGAWNRGASRITFNFVAVPQPEITASTDSIAVKMDPCQLPKLGWPVSYLLSRNGSLKMPCLQPDPRTVTWGGVKRYIYQLK